MEPASSAGVRCSACGGDLGEATLLTCLHALCRSCLPTPAPSAKGDNNHNSPVFLCPACRPKSASDVTQVSRRSLTSFPPSRIAAKPSVAIEELKRKSEVITSGCYDNGADDNSDEDEEEGGGDSDIGNGDAGVSGSTSGEVYSTSLVFSCSLHSHRDAESYCLACEQLVCRKCVTAVHRKCAQQLVTCTEAVVARRSHLNVLHSKLAKKVVRSQESVTSDSAILAAIEEQRAALIGQISAQREALVRAIIDKEAGLVQELNAALDKEKSKVEARLRENRWSGKSAEGQLNVLEAVISVQGEPEILSAIPSLSACLDQETANYAWGPFQETVTLMYTPDLQLEDAVSKSALGSLTVASSGRRYDDVPLQTGSDVNLTLMTSFHGRTREDVCEPLLTDLVMLPSGDVILTDRDNRCVKKFNATGHLLTRVPIPEVPSRIALVSQGKAVISVMNKRVLFFVSLLGTVRILSSVRLKRPYCFLASAGDGPGQGQGQGQVRLLAATSQCDEIDLITESGVALRRLYQHKGERVALSRPLFLHVPLARDPDVFALVVDSGRRTLLGLTGDGQVTFTFKPTAERALECPLGVATLPGSGFILLADRDTNRVLLLGRRGAWLKDLLTEKDALHKPCALHADARGRVALTQVDGWVKIYRTQ